MTHLGHGVMSPAIRAKPIGTRKEIRLEDRLQDQLESTLDHPIPQRGDGGFIVLPFPGVVRLGFSARRGVCMSW